MGRILRLQTGGL